MHVSKYQGFLNFKPRYMLTIKYISKSKETFKYSPFRLTSLIYAKKFEFENPAIMEGKQCKQTERFSVMTKGRDYFLS